METQFIGGDGEIPRWNRDKLWKGNLKVDDDEISKVEKETIIEMQIDLHLWQNSNVGKRQMWKCNENCIYDEIPMGTRPIFNSVEYSES